MATIGINGLGRIGRCVLRTAIQKGVKVGAINSLDDPQNLVHHLKFDSTHGHWDADIQVTDEQISINGQKTHIFSSKDPADLRWGDKGVDVVMECTGVFKTSSQCAPHLKNGAKKVIVSAPSSDIDGTFVMGVNHHEYDPSKHHVVSNASCTTNCLAPLSLVLHKEFGIKKGLMTTIHSYTLDQMLLDGSHTDLRRSRAAATSIIPTSTGAASAVGLVLPELQGLLTGLALRVPTMNVSLVDLVFESEKQASAEAVNEACQKASQTYLKGILDCEQRPLVSVDFNGNTHSSIVDTQLTQVIKGNLVKVFSWYDNEVGFTHRMIDLANEIGS